MKLTLTSILQAEVSQTKLLDVFFESNTLLARSGLGYERFHSGERLARRSAKMIIVSKPRDDEWMSVEFLTEHCDLQLQEYNLGGEQGDQLFV
jgi:hypothetical protein